MLKLETGLDVLKNFSQNENKLSWLYSAYAKKFPEQVGLWERLAQDEKRHSLLLFDLAERFKEEAGSWSVSPSASVILTYIGNFIDDCLKQAESSNLNFAEAINQALSLEQSMIEKKSFEIFSSSNLEVAEVLEKLNRETEGHRQRLAKFIKAKI